MTSSGKRKIWAESKKQRKKKKKAATETERMEDRLSDLPEELKLGILGCLDTKQAVQTSILSRSWVSMWTRIPVLDINFYSFRNNPQRFRKFVKKVLSRRDPLAKLDSLKFKYYNYKYRMQCSAKFLKRVFDYAFSHGVKHLTAVIDGLSGTDSSWPVSLCDSLTSLKLKTCQIFCDDMIRSPFLGPRSVLFKNLTDLSLIGAEITDVDEPLSWFPVLERLILRDCNCWIKGTTDDIHLKVHAFRLTYFAISNCNIGPCLELRTPRLRSLKYEYNYTIKNEEEDDPVLKHEGLPVLETLEMDFPQVNIYHYQPIKKRKFDDLMSFLSTLHNVKSLTLHLDTVFLLLSFSDELVSSPFRELKELKLDFFHIDCPELLYRINQNPNASRESFECVKAYLLQNSPRAKLTMIDFPQHNKSCTCFRFLNS